VLPAWLYKKELAALQRPLQLAVRTLANLSCHVSSCCV